jgi:polyisoprenoid-binding protein YceI
MTAGNASLLAGPFDQLNTDEEALRYETLQYNHSNIMYHHGRRFPDRASITRRTPMVQSLRRSLVVLFALGIVAMPAAAAETVKVDPVHSSIVFKIQHAGISWIYGRFDKFEGAFTLDKEDPANSSFALSIKTESIDSNNPQRDGHLRGPDFFNAKQFPLLTFKSTSVNDLTMHGVTKPISFVLHGGKEAQFPPGTRRIGFNTELIIKRGDFNVGPAKFAGLLGDDVHAEIALEVVVQK